MQIHVPTAFGRHLVSTFLAAFLLAGNGILAVGYAQSQVNIPDTAISADLSSLVEQGRQLEEDQRWLEALSFYDKAVRDNPGAEDLRLRRTLAQIHCDLDRRYVDSSYLRLIATMSQRQAMDMFNEIILKVQSHYVSEPDWQKLTWRGTANLDIALTKEAFLSHHLAQRSQAGVNAFRHLLRDDVNQRLVRSRTEARDLVVYASQLAERELGVPAAKAIAEYCCGAIASLDQYSTYLTGGQLDDVYNQIEGNFVGLGIELKAEDDALLIVKVIPDGPAARSGIQTGDRITAVDGQPTGHISTDKAAEMLKGEQNSIVEVTLRGRDKTIRNVRVRRERVEVPCVEHVRIIDPQSGIGYFNLTSFQKTTSRDVDAALWKLHRSSMRSLVIDLRGNPGGLLTAAVEVADKFIVDGTIVSTRGRSPREDYDYKAHRASSWRVPLVVLIDGDTASASEIFAAAVRDHGRATVVGERSYGKGSVQGIFPLSSARSGVRLTTAKFYSPKGQPISDRGVQPHRVVKVQQDQSDELFGQPPNEQNDPVLAAACETARRLTVANR